MLGNANHLRPQRRAISAPGYDQSKEAGQRGFSLVEVAVVLVLVTLLLGGLLTPLGAQVEQRRISETEKRLGEIKEALLGFTVTNGFMPCPAKSATDGTEDRASAGTCNKRHGFLPWITLGIAPGDAWSNLFRYSVDPDFARSDALFGISDKGDIVIWTRDAAGAEKALTNSSTPEIPAMVLSHGPNGFGATSDLGTARATPSPWSGDESYNATNGSANKFYSRIRTMNPAAAGGGFDDLVVWISPSILASRMVAAGRF